MFFGSRGWLRSTILEIHSPGRLRSTILKIHSRGRLCHTSLYGRNLLFGNDTEGRDGFVKMVGFQFIYRTISQLIRSAKVRYSGSFLPVFTKFERL